MTIAIPTQSSNTVNSNIYSPSKDAANKKNSRQNSSPLFSDKRTPILHQKLFNHSNLLQRIQNQLRPSVTLSEAERNLIAENLLNFYYKNEQKLSPEVVNSITTIYWTLRITDEYNKNNIHSAISTIFELLNSMPFSGPSAERAQLINDLQQVLSEILQAPLPETPHSLVTQKEASLSSGNNARHPPISPVNIPDPFPEGNLRIQLETSETENTRTLIPPTGDSIDDKLLQFFYNGKDEIPPKFQDSIKNYSYQFLAQISNFRTALKNNDPSLASKRKELIEDFKNFLIHESTKFYHENPSNFSRVPVTSLRNYIYAPINDVNAHSAITLLIKHLKKYFLNNPIIEIQSRNSAIQLIEGLQIILFTLDANPDSAKPPSTPSSILQDLSDFLEENEEKIPPELQNSFVHFTHALNGKNFIFKKTFSEKTKDDRVYYFCKLFIHHLKNFLLKNPELKMDGDKLIKNLQKLVLSPLNPSDDSKEELETEIDFMVAMAAEMETIGATLKNPPEISIGAKPPITNSPADLEALRSFDQRRAEFDAIVAEYDDKIEKVKFSLTEATNRYNKTGRSDTAAHDKIVELKNEIAQLEKELNDKMFAAAGLPQHLRAEIRLEYSDSSATKPYNHDDNHINGIQSALSRFVKSITNRSSFPQNEKKTLETIEKALRIGQTETKKINYLPSIRRKLLRCVNDLYEFLKKKNLGAETLRHLQSARDGLLDKEKYSQETLEERKKRLIPPPSHLEGLKRALAFFPRQHNKIPATISVARNSESTSIGYFYYSEEGPAINIDISQHQNADETGTFCHELGHLLASLDPRSANLGWEYLKKNSRKDSNGHPIIRNGVVQGLPHEEIFGTYRARVDQDLQGNYYAREAFSQGLEDMCLRAGTLYKKDPDRFKLIYDFSRALAQNSKDRGEPMKNAQV